ncbi:hypothetical protein HORIV_45810 [Vreelandella olivaria]|uniref:Uncharacterized protein n=1 Tax=Vreelandella olivaria TaxID=390919 RepID=A0ABN5X4Y9_9GAMM|nr:hypothetical protein HORIV_45810 [Halomonas olivaria]
MKEQPRDLLDQLTQGAAHQGVVAFCPPLTPEGEESLWLKLRAWPSNTPPLLLILDGVTDVHNFGACLRSADAAGAHGVIVARIRLHRSMQRCAKSPVVLPKSCRFIK